MVEVTATLICIDRLLSMPVGSQFVVERRSVDCFRVSWVDDGVRCGCVEGVTGLAETIEFVLRAGARSQKEVYEMFYPREVALGP